MSLQKLSPVHIFMAREIALRGVSRRELAKMTDMAYESVCRVANDPLFDEEVNRIRNRTEERLLQQRDEALKPLYENLTAIMERDLEIALHSENEAVSHKACNDLMRFVIRTKGEDKEKEDEAGHLMVQLGNLGKHEDDPDVNPAANPNVVSIIEGEKTGTDDV